MDAEQLLDTLIRGALGARRKRSRGALGFLTGGRHSLLNAGTLLTAAGVAWGMYEAATQQGAGTAPAPAGSDRGPATGAGAATRTSAPPLPVSAGPQAEAAPLLAPDAAGTPAPAVGSGATPMPPDILRVIRLTIAAARADGTLTAREQDAILAHARSVGAESVVARELQQPTPLPAIVAGAPPVQRDDLYTLAFAVARADETVSGGERIFLAQLAHQLGLEAAAVAELERVAAERIAAAV
jgi:hypothetical protein